GNESGEDSLVQVKGSGSVTMDGDNRPFKITMTHCVGHWKGLEGWSNGDDGRK
ncbi:hypothetical protein HAX54_050789, partial [Datura stramonium]|nr:hypothetical protein [Datura stramonium]